MYRLIWGFVGRTFQIGGNLMSRLTWVYYQKSVVSVFSHWFRLWMVLNCSSCIPVKHLWYLFIEANRPRGYKLFSCSTQLSMNFIFLINVKTISESSKASKIFNFHHFSFLLAFKISCLVESSKKTILGPETASWDSVNSQGHVQYPSNIICLFFDILIEYPFLNLPIKLPDNIIFCVCFIWQKQVKMIRIQTDTRHR